MMDQACINSIMDLVFSSNMIEKGIYALEERPIEYESNDINDDRHCVKMCISDHLGFNRKAPLYEAWPAGNLLLFTVFDGVLENKYNLTEGESFSKHYKAIPENDDFDIMTKNCYRILKIIRNGIQHSLSSINHSNSKDYIINYSFNGTNFTLNITEEGTRSLYTYVTNFITGKIKGLAQYITDGHYKGIMRTIYETINAEISNLSDEFGTSLLNIGQGLSLRASVRYPLINPRIINQDDKSITFYHLENNGTDDETSAQYQYSTDYVYNGHLLPQELGKINKYSGSCSEKRLTRGTITFNKSDINILWQIKN
ncbi:MAG: hypothetical protein IJT21_00840 [Synergistaceae bacterium]|nr:hypothetical protein [Synergistaceae bacterium]